MLLVGKEKLIMLMLSILKASSLFWDKENPK